MRTSHSLILASLIAFIGVGCGKKDDPAKPGSPSAAAGIEGEYIVVGGEMWGEAATQKEIEKDTEAERTITITKDSIEMKMMGDKKEKLKYTIDASKSPAELDIQSDAKGKDKTSYGIYKLEGDTLTFFVFGAEEAKNRPKEFKTVDFTKKENEGKPGGSLMVTAKKNK